MHCECGAVREEVGTSIDSNDLGRIWRDAGRLDEVAVLAPVTSFDNHARARIDENRAHPEAVLGIQSKLADRRLLHGSFLLTHNNT